MIKKLKLIKYFVYDKIYVNVCNMGRFLMEALYNLKIIIEFVYLYVKSDILFRTYLTVIIPPMFILVLSESLFTTLYCQYYGLYPEFFFFGMPRYEEISIPLSLLEPPLSEEVLLAQQQESMQAIWDNPGQENRPRYLLGVCFGLIAAGAVVIILSGRI